MQPSSSSSTPAATPEKPVKTKKAKRRGGDRLPQFFKGVVTDEQKEKVYAIQDEYAPKLKALNDQLKTLTEERNAKIDDLLTPDQKATVQAKRAEAAAKRAEPRPSGEKAQAKRAEKRKAGTRAPSTSPPRRRTSPSRSHRPTNRSRSRPPRPPPSDALS